MIRYISSISAWAGIFLLLLPRVQASPLVDSEWLARNLGKAVILDVRDDDESFSVSGHIFGAVYVDWAKVIVERKDGDVPLLQMLPGKKAFEALMQASGVNNDSSIVITSQGKTLGQTIFATRLYWTLKYFGHDKVGILNGGTAQWVDAGHRLEYGKSVPKKGNFKAGKQRTEILAVTSEVAAIIDKGGVQLVDVRAEDLYSGERYSEKLVKPHAQGHLPGAKHLPQASMIDNMGAAAVFYSAEEIEDEAMMRDVDTETPAIFYCDSGTTASIGWFVWHELLGQKNTRLYDGSMHQWSRDPKRLVKK
ncbi:MAG: sulfurtransferase [Gammaproteobacteria bacterium]|nr:sulfurtransferase [Gammaproteobacteria bacterium]